MKPIRSLLQGRPYTNAASTDLAATFRRIRREMKAEQDRLADQQAKPSAKVREIKQRVK